MTAAELKHQLAHGLAAFAQLLALLRLAQKLLPDCHISLFSCKTWQYC